MNRLVLGFAFLLCTQSNAGEEIKNFQIPYEVNHQIKITGFKGDIELVPAKETQSTRISIVKTTVGDSSLPDDILAAINHWDPVVETRENVIQISFREPQTRDFWQRKDYQEIMPRFKIQITGYNLPADIYWWRGDIKTQNWKNTVNVTLHTGDVDLNKVEGESRINIQSGSVKALGQKGNVSIHAYDAKVTAKDIEGTLEIDNFIGVTAVDNVDGSVQLSSFSGRNKFNDVKGNLNFQLKIGYLDIEDLEGSLRGENGDGQVRANLAGAPDVRIRSQGGGVNLSVSRAYSTNVNVGSVEGELKLPSNIKVQRGSNMKYAVGKVHGGGEKEGNIFARSQSGIIGLNVR